jgi:hypothetical protein
MTMQYGDIPANHGERRMQRRVLNMIGDIPIVGADQYSLSVLIDDREVKVACETTSNRDGTRSHIYSTSIAIYVDDKSRIGPHVRERLEANIKQSYEGKETHVKFE